MQLLFPVEESMLTNAFVHLTSSLQLLARTHAMRSCARIVVEEQDVNHWTAWIVGSPDLAVQGRSLGNALTNMLLEFGVEEFEVKNLSMDREATREGHLEFCVPLRRRRPIPIVSVN